MKYLLLICTLLLAVVIQVQPKPVAKDALNFFKEIAKEAFKGAKIEDESLTDSLTEIIGEDCGAVCPPDREGDFGAHLIQCIRCIADEFGTPVFPEFLESVLVVRSPVLVEEEIEEEGEIFGDDEESASSMEDGESESSTEDGSEEEIESVEDVSLDEILIDSVQLPKQLGGIVPRLEQLSESFEEGSIAIFTALLGPCKDDCGSVVVPNTDPVPCLKCISANSFGVSFEFVDRALALFDV